jgi:type I restriction enzyme R subunit
MPAPEARARQVIDAQLAKAGWVVQDHADFDKGAGLGVAVREYPLPGGPADYLLFVDGKAAGIVEAKKTGTTLSGVAEQAEEYAAALPAAMAKWADPLPFLYESTGIETLFRDERDPKPRSRDIFHFHRPETLLGWLKQPDTLRARLRNLPKLDPAQLRNCQIDAIAGLEKSLARDDPRALVQMATGAGKTVTACAAIYRMVKFGGAKRVLFLVDRKNLGEQAQGALRDYRPPDDGRPLGALYNIQLLKSNRIDADAKIVITTIQRLFSILRGEAEYDDTAEELSGFEGAADAAPQTVAYNPAVPIEEFDIAFIDECHRSIYNLWRQVLEYFDAHLIGLTATPSKHTLGFFKNNLVAEYPFERSVVDGVNVGFEIYRIKTQVGEKGGRVEAGYQVGMRDRRTRNLRWETLDADLVYQPKDLDRAVTVPDQIRTVLKHYRDALKTTLFPDRTWVPKTLIFAKDDAHAEEIVKIAREVFGEGDDFAKKITYRTTGESAKDLLQRFCNDPFPRIVATVDMIATGTDVKPIEVVMFLRDVKSSLYYEQMKGRGARSITPDELQKVTPDAKAKTGFVLIDAIGVTESLKADTQPMERLDEKKVPFKKLIERIAAGWTDDDAYSSLSARLAKLDRAVGPEAREAVAAIAKGSDIADLAAALYDAVDEDRVAAEAVAQFGAGASDDPKKIEMAREALKTRAAKPFENPALRRVLADLKAKADMVIDQTTIDAVVDAGYDFERAKKMIADFKTFLEANRDALAALKIIYGKRYATRPLTYAAIRELAEALERPPVHLTTPMLWQAYANLEQNKVRRVTDPGRLLTNIVALVRYAIGQDDMLEEFDVSVTQRYNLWLGRQIKAGKNFSAVQRAWLDAIKDHIAANVAIDKSDLLDNPVFADKGGLVAYRSAFGAAADEILKDMNGALVA